jgi:hypothetical protein
MCDFGLQYPVACRTANVVNLSFENVASVSMSGALMVLATFEASSSLGNAELVGTYSKNQRINRELQGCGFYSLLNGTDTDVVDGSRLMFHPLSGTTSDGQAVETLLKGCFPAQTLNAESVEIIYAGITEASANSVEHAYDDGIQGSDVARSVNRRWWLAGRHERSRGRFVFAICDLGYGIVHHLQRDAFQRHEVKWSQYESSVDFCHSLVVIDAMRQGGTSTDLPWRGKGLPQIRNVIDALGGTLRVATNMAICTYSSGTFTPTEMSDSFAGTYIEWSIPVRTLRP